MPSAPFASHWSSSSQLSNTSISILLPYTTLFRSCLLPHSVNSYVRNPHDPHELRRPPHPLHRLRWHHVAHRVHPRSRRPTASPGSASVNDTYRWNEWNLDHIATHGIFPEQAEYII